MKTSVSKEKYLCKNKKFTKPFSPVHMGPRSNLLSKKWSKISWHCPFNLVSWDLKLIIYSWIDQQSTLFLLLSLLFFPLSGKWGGFVYRLSIKCGQSMHFFKPLIKFVHQVCITNKVKTNNNKKNLHKYVVHPSSSNHLILFVCTLYAQLQRRETKMVSKRFQF